MEKILNEYLKELRENANLSKEELAKILKITLSQVEILEKGEFNKLPPFVLKQILKKYKDFFKLKEDLVIKEKNISFVNFYKEKPLIKEGFRLELPIILIIFFCVLIFILYQIFNLIMPPKIKIIYPPNNIVSYSKVIKIKGYVDTRSKFFINGEMVIFNEKGYFEKEAILKKGANKFVLEAENYFGLKSIETLTIYYY
jgi:transcriptional regulator with XRE-family HTH domain